jgi:hypothetical protein
LADAAAAARAAAALYERCLPIDGYIGRQPLLLERSHSVGGLVLASSRLREITEAGCYYRRHDAWVLRVTTI